MSIRMMCDKDTPGAVKDEYWSKQASSPEHPDREIWLIESHKGLVLSLREMNGYDDSDFYALVWNSEKQITEEIMYASTRGWTYPNSAGVDATPEVLAEWNAVRERGRVAAAAKRAAIEAGTPRPGRLVRVVKAVTKGKSVCKVGEMGVVFWYGRDDMKLARRARYMSPAAFGLLQSIYDPREFYRAGVKLNDGRKVFLPAMSLEVVEQHEATT